MPYRLYFQLDQHRHRALLPEGELIVGSSPECGLQLDFPTISRRHARLQMLAGVLRVEDLGSSNGTWLDGARLRQAQTVQAGQALRLGEVEVTIEQVNADEASVALAMQGDAPDQPGAAAERTLQAAGGEARFWRRALPDLLAYAATDASRLGMARRVGEAALAGLDVDAVELSVLHEDTAQLFRAGEPDGEAQQYVEAGLRLRLWPSRGDFDGRLLQALLRLVLLAPTAADTSTGTKAAEPDPEGPVNADPAMREIHRRAREVARSSLNVLIRGESGTGKEVLAQLIRRHAGDADAAFVALNCAALAEDLIDAELFGIERGVATGVEARAGKFEQAHGGILFLDEIGDMAPATQARMLRVLQEGEVTRIGGRQPRPAQVRVIAASNKDIDAMLADGRFRLDLLHRIADWQITLPPLRQRLRDIPLLAIRFLDAACRARGVSIRGISRAAHDALLAYHWPGNVRELQREMARVAVFLSDGDVLAGSDLRQPLVRSGTPPGEDLRSQMEVAERRILELALLRCGGNMSEAAQRLGIARSTLYRRLDALGIDAAGSDEAEK